LLIVDFDPCPQIVMMPYQMLLHRETREAQGIDLRGNVVIIDEAHNLMEAINSVHSVFISGAQLCAAFHQLDNYLQRYSSRLHPQNLQHVRSLLNLIDRLILALSSPSLSCLSTNTPSSRSWKDEFGESEEKINKKEEESDGNQTIIKEELLSVTQLLFGLDLGDLNLLILLQWCKQSELSKKVAFLFFLSFNPVQSFAESINSSMDLSKRKEEKKK